MLLNIVLSLVVVAIAAYVVYRNIKKKKEAEHNEIYKDVEDKLKAILGTKVSINRQSGNKGKIEIEYYSNEELERLLELFGAIH